MVWNLLGMGLPILVAVGAIPFLIGVLGESRFGVLTVAWLVFGYFSIFDLGLHRALTQLVARAIGRDEHHAIPGLFWTALLLMAVAGVVGGVIVGAGAPWIVKQFDTGAILYEEAVNAFLLMAVGLPVLTSTAGLRGMLEAHHRFASVAVVQLWHGTWTFLGPLVVAYAIAPQLEWVVGGLLVGRLITWVAYFTLATRAAPAVWSAVRPARAAVRPLLSYGGWMTLAHSVVPIVLYGDRFFIGSLLGPKAVAHYATPAEMVGKLLIVPQAIVGVLFPTFAATYDRDAAAAGRIFDHGLKAVLIVFTPIALLGVAVGPEVMELWLRFGNSADDAAQFVADSGPVLQVLVIGMLLGGLTLIPTSLIQGVGKPKWTALVFLAELPVWALLMYALTGRFGITGTAIAWLARQSLEGAIMLALAQRLTHEPPRRLFARLLAASAVTAGLLLVAFTGPLWQRLALAGVAGPLFLALAWWVVLDAEQRAWVALVVGKRLGRGARDASTGMV
jgi:O-antigen/teichoic acid export membrane protein